VRLSFGRKPPEPLPAIGPPQKPTPKVREGRPERLEEILPEVLDLLETPGENMVANQREEDIAQMHAIIKRYNSARTGNPDLTIAEWLYQNGVRPRA
jgi:hypothetical protein